MNIKGNVTEKEFANYYAQNVLQKDYPNYAFYFIETEETQRGFPDLMLVERDTQKALFFEFKVADSRGVITFQRTQPAFYKKNPFLNVTVVAYLPASACPVIFYAKSLFDKDSVFYLRDNLEVRL
jgi:hypothetical protein